MHCRVMCALKLVVLGTVHGQARLRVKIDTTLALIALQTLISHIFVLKQNLHVHVSKLSLEHH